MEVAREIDTGTGGSEKAEMEDSGDRTEGRKEASQEDAQGNEAEATPFPFDIAARAQPVYSQRIVMAIIIHTCYICIACR